MTRMILLSAAMVCLLAGGIIGCGEDVTIPREAAPPIQDQAPRVTFESATAQGLLYDEPFVLPLTDSDHRDGYRDTIPMGAEVTFEWTGLDDDEAGEVVGYRFRMTGDDDFTWVDQDVTSITYSGLPAGAKKFRLAAVDNTGAMTVPDSTRVFVVANFAPDTWYDPVFIERRKIGGCVEEFERGPGDTVAVGSELQFYVHATDPDGDDERLSYTASTTTHYTCGGQSSPGFVFFDVESGPSYSYVEKLPQDPRYGGYVRTSVWAKDEHNLRDPTLAVLTFYSNLPPVLSMADVYVNGDALDVSSSFKVDDSVAVKVISAVDPDPGNKPVSFETRCALHSLDGAYSGSTGWQTLGEDMMLHGIAQAGRYKLTVRVMDAGCRETALDKEIEIIVR